MDTILVLHGPNMNLLGKREPDQYGHNSLAWINTRLMEEGRRLGVTVEILQSNREGELMDHLQAADGAVIGVVFNPGGYTHTSVALRDTVAAIRIPVVEVHLSNISAREEFRQTSMIAPVCAGTIAGFGWYSYLLGMHALLALCEESTGDDPTAG